MVNDFSYLTLWVLKKILQSLTDSDIQPEAPNPPELENRWFLEQTTEFQLQHHLC